MTTQTGQMEASPKTTMDTLESLRAFHVADLEKARTALDNLSGDEKAARRYEKAEERLAAAQGLVRDIDRAIADLQGVNPTVEEVVRGMRRTVEESGITVTLAADAMSVTFGGKDKAATGETPDVDPVTGEVAPAVVAAIYPGNDEPHETSVGDRTRYAELVADYLTAAGIDSDVDADEWAVVAERELGDPSTDYGCRILHDVINSGDYGERLVVVATKQGSVTGYQAQAGGVTA
jgi:hypothetical protein